MEARAIRGGWTLIRRQRDLATVSSGGAVLPKDTAQTEGDGQKQVMIHPLTRQQRPRPTAKVVGKEVSGDGVGGTESSSREAEQSKGSEGYGSWNPLSP